MSGLGAARSLLAGTSTRSTALYEHPRRVLNSSPQAPALLEEEEPRLTERYHRNHDVRAGNPGEVFEAHR
jgi:hypothetical protein